MSGTRTYRKTPRTDERIVEMRGKEWVPATFARKLEVELQAKQPQQNTTEKACSPKSS